MTTLVFIDYLFDFKAIAEILIMKLVTSIFIVLLLSSIFKFETHGKETDDINNGKYWTKVNLKKIVIIFLLFLIIFQRISMLYTSIIFQKQQKNIMKGFLQLIALVHMKIILIYQMPQLHAKIHLRVSVFMTFIVIIAISDCAIHLSFVHLP